MPISRDTPSPKTYPFIKTYNSNLQTTPNSFQLIFAYNSTLSTTFFPLFNSPLPTIPPHHPPAYISDQILHTLAPNLMVHGCAA